MGAKPSVLSRAQSRCEDENVGLLLLQTLQPLEEILFVSLSLSTSFGGRGYGRFPLGPLREGDAEAGGARVGGRSNSASDAGRTWPGQVLAAA